MENLTTTELVERLRDNELAFAMAVADSNRATNFDRMFQAEDAADEFERESYEIAQELDKRFEESFPEDLT